MKISHPTIGTTLFVGLLLVASMVLLPGCASLDSAGHSAYSATAVKDATGKVIGYELAVKDGKEFANRQIQFQAKGDAVAVTITEGESKAFKGQAISAKALSLFPVTGLQDLLK
jgi:hypothetical protein